MQNIKIHKKLQKIEKFEIDVAGSPIGAANQPLANVIVVELT